MGYKKINVTNRTIFGIAKSAELKLSNDDLHAIVLNQTGKEHISELTKREKEKVVSELVRLKESVSKQSRKSEHPSNAGNEATVNQRKKIYKLTEALGWKDKSRLSGMCKRMFGIESVEWLNYRQCSDLIEALKNMADREEKKTGDQNHVTGNK